jgi:hypothetical protein
MPALVAGIHVLISDTAKSWMTGTKPGHDEWIDHCQSQLI